MKIIRKIKQLSLKSKKLIVLAFVLFAGCNLVYQYYLYKTLEKNTFDNGKDFAITSTKEIEKEINLLLKTVETETESTIQEFSKKERLTKEEIALFCESKARSIPQISGVSISFEPYEFSKEDRLFSVFYDKHRGISVRLDTIYNYTDSTLIAAKWYTEVVKNKLAGWDTPYYAGSTKNLVTDYSSPIIKEGRIIGVVTYTLSINDLIDIMHDISLGKGGFGFLINKTGTVITHPNSDLVLKKNVSSVFRNQAITDSVVSKPHGFLQQYDTQDRTISLCYEELCNHDWKLITVFSDIDLFENNQALKDKLINLFISASIFIALILLLIIYQEGITRTEAWTFSFSVTAILITNIVFVWYLNLNDRYNTEQNTDIIITDKTAADNFISLQNTKRKQFSIKPLHEIPTGIFLEKIEYQDSYNVGMSGWIWQKYPLNNAIEPALYFPQLSPFAEANYLQKIDEIEKSDHILVKWYFRSTFIFNFDYLKYPFNTKTVKLKIGYPDFDKNIILTPDIKSYKSLNTSELPGISKDSRTSSLRYISTKFSFTHHELSGDFDSKALAEMGNIPMLQFEIKTRRPFLNAFIKQMIPITLVSLMIYLLLFNLREHNGTERKTVGIEAIAGLLFILVLSHIDFRKTIFSPSITYLESFYFVIYFIIAVFSINIVLFDLAKKNFLTRENNKFLKLVFWPFFFLSIFVVTLLIFY